MKIHWIHVRNTRGVRDHRIDFTDGVTVIEGDNEVGKTTIFEAFDLLIDTRYPADSAAAAIKSIRPTHTGANPEVSVEMTAGEYRFTYRKVWSEGRHAVTELVVTDPAPETLHGRPAHDRVGEILAETTDLALGKALRIAQREVVSQPQLGGKPGLLQALDAAAGKSAASVQGDMHNAALIAAVTAEYEQYFQPKKGGTRGEYAAAIAERDQAEKALAEQELAVERVAQLLEDYERVEALVVETDRETREHKPRLAALESRWTELAERAQAVKELETVAAAAQREAADAARLASDREALRSEASDAETRAQQQSVLAADCRAAAATSAISVKAAESVASEAAEAANSAHAAATAAASDRDYLRDLDELEALTARHARAVAAETVVTDAEAALAPIRVTADGLADIEKAHDKALRAEAALEAASAQVELQALALVTIHRGGERYELAAGETFTWRLAQDAAVTVGDHVRLTAAVGNGERDQRKKAADAARVLADLCQQAGAADAADARGQLEQRRILEAARDSARTALAAELDGNSVGEIRNQCAQLAVRADVYKAGREHGALPATRAEAEERVRSATSTEEELGAAAAVSSAKAIETRAAANKTETAAAVADQQAADVRGRAEQLGLRLTEAREKESDEDLQSRAVQAAEASANASDIWQAAVDIHNTDDPASVTQDLDDERAIGNKLAKAAEQLGIELVRLDATLQKDRNAQEECNAAAERCAAAVRRHDSMRRRAEAAQLLHTTLSGNRNRAKREYVAPFKTKLEELAVIVFGHTLKLDVNEDLEIATRTLHGATVPFDQLSGGAREQLAVCARLAAAALVEEGGAPVVIDDALGFTDPDRLRKLGRVFTAAECRSQVIVLTCTPGRYRGITGATTHQFRRGHADGSTGE